MPERQMPVPHIVSARPHRGFALETVLLLPGQTRRGWTARESIDRGARFIGLALARDVQEAGIAMESTPTFASLGTLSARRELWRHLH